jgi:hypothetical protein
LALGSGTLCDAFCIPEVRSASFVARSNKKPTTKPGGMDAARFSSFPPFIFFICFIQIIFTNIL